MGSIGHTREAKVPEQTSHIAARLRSEREIERFSQYELAAEIGITRAALSSFELCQNPLPFAVGFEFCRRLDILPRWLATGEEPKRPFVPLAELAISQADLQPLMRRGVTFLSGYEQALRRPINAWIKQNPNDKIIMRVMRAGIEPLAQRWSNAELVSQLEKLISALESSDQTFRAANAESARKLLAEMSARLATRRGKKRP